MKKEAGADRYRDCRLGIYLKLMAKCLVCIAFISRIVQTFLHIIH